MSHRSHNLTKGLRTMGKHVNLSSVGSSSAGVGLLMILAALLSFASLSATGRAQTVKPDVTGGPGGSLNPELGLTSSSSSTTYGNPLTITSHIVPGLCAYGYLTFSDNGTTIGIAYWSGGAQPTAAFTTSSLAVGSHTIGAIYGGYTSSTNTCNATTQYLFSQVVNPATPTISISNLPSSATYGGSFTAAYNYSGNGSPSESVSSSTTGVCTTSGSTVSYVGVGTCTLSASSTATTDYTAATGSAQSFTVGQATPTISINNLPSSAKYGGSFTATYGYSGNGSPAESVASSTTSVCTTSGSTVSYVGVGTCTLTASSTATTDYTAATGSAQSFTVGPATPTISINNLPSNPGYGGSFTATYSYSGNGSPSKSVSSSTTNVCTASGSTVNYVGTGTCTLSASATATTDYGAVTGSPQSFSIVTARPTISWATPAPISYGTPLSATQLDATANAPGTFVYTPAAGTVPDFGSQTLSVTFTPTNTADDTTATASVTLTVTTPTDDLYFYLIANNSGGSGYDAVGNVLNYSDSVTGTWNFSNSTGSGYDSLNRLSLATQTPVGRPSQSFCWTYDSFGNRTAQDVATQPFTNAAGSVTCQMTGSALPSTSATYNAYNQFKTTTQDLGTPGYDFAGNLTNDGTYQYLYDAEGRLCAVKNLSSNIMTGYLYDANGTRVAKGSLTAMTCDPSANLSQFQSTETDYIVGPSGEQVTEMDMVNGTLTWKHTNAWASGKILATYDSATNNTLFYLSDWLGTKRVEVGANPCATAYSSLPYGDNQPQPVIAGYSPCQDNATEHYFTGKERDTESENDYFGARYYGNNMGRFMSPDPSGVYFGDPTNPQSLNLYSYVLNNPLTGTDPTGRAYCQWDDGTHDDSANTGVAGAVNSGTACTNQGGTWSHVDGLGDDGNPLPTATPLMQISVIENSNRPINPPVNPEVLNLTDPTLLNLNFNPPSQTLPKDMHFEFQPVVSYTPWQMVKRWFNCWATDDPNRHIGPKPPDPKASTDTVPNQAANLRSEHTSKKYGGATGVVTDGPRLNSGQAVEGMGTTADAAGMVNDVNNCAGGGK